MKDGIDDDLLDDKVINSDGNGIKLSASLGSNSD